MVASGRSWAQGRLPGLGPQGQRPGASEAPEAGEALGGREGGAGCGMWARGGFTLEAVPIWVRPNKDFNRTVMQIWCRSETSEESFCELPIARSRRRGGGGGAGCGMWRLTFQSSSRPVANTMDLIEQSSKYAAGVKTSEEPFWELPIARARAGMDLAAFVLYFRSPSYRLHIRISIEQSYVFRIGDESCDAPFCEWPIARSTGPGWV